MISLFSIQKHDRRFSPQHCFLSFLFVGFLLHQLVLVGTLIFILQVFGVDRENIRVCAKTGNRMKLVTRYKFLPCFKCAMDDLLNFSGMC